MNRLRVVWLRVALIAGMIAAVAVAAGAGDQW